ncbi:MAG: PASTA domain-containing protein [Prevotellaceae bacterium]|nr:PASTA domain-containing protein [Prevotellaceae bacterium]
MNIKKYFTGKTGLIFWANVLLAAALIVGIPYGVFVSLNAFTHHGEKIEVPNVTQKTYTEALEMLNQRDLIAVVSDSVFDKNYAPGTILSQLPAAGNEVKSGRQIYLTVNMKGLPPVKMPDLVRNATERIAEMRLKQLGFKLSKTQRVEGEPEGLVISIKQNGKRVNAGEMITRDLPLTIVAGAGFPEDTLDIDSFGIVNDGGFDIAL